MKRSYESVLKEHLSRHRQMLFLAGPRQVGKTTLSLVAKSVTDNFHYFNFDNQDHRLIIMKGPAHVATTAQLDIARSKKTVVVFDELHKYRDWKQFLKGFYDTYSDLTHIIVTGSAKLAVYQSSGDSLMGRYLLYRVHPLSISEIESPTAPNTPISPSAPVDPTSFQNLIQYGGFPEPFIKQNDRFFRQWHRLRHHQLFREDIRDLTQIHEIAQLELLAHILESNAGGQTNYSTLSNQVNVSVDTIRRWTTVLEEIYHSFSVRPWSKNITRSLIKEPKTYLWDWSRISDPGSRHENFVASHLLKAVHYWTDSGFGDYGLTYLRDKEKHEVDFLVTQNNEPWIMVEVKTSATQSLSPNIARFQSQCRAPHAFQVAFDLPDFDGDCFGLDRPQIVPVQSFLRQLV